MALNTAVKEILDSIKQVSSFVCPVKVICEMCYCNFENGHVRPIMSYAACIDIIRENTSSEQMKKQQYWAFSYACYIQQKMGIHFLK